MVKIYSMMGLYEEAVSLALKNGDLASAKEVANKPEADDLKKKLWLQITISRLKNNDDIQSILTMTEEAENIIKIDVPAQQHGELTGFCRTSCRI